MLMRCAHCGTEFQRGPGYSRASTAKYCSAKCQLNRRTPGTPCAVRACVVCGNAIERKPGMRGTLPRVCSPTCRDTLHPPAPAKEKACARCGQPIKHGPDRPGRHAKYCSDQCRRAAGHSSLSDKACRVCGSLLTVTQARNALGVCSRQCMLRSMKHARTKACAICGDQFEAKYSGQACCSSVCANAHAGKTRAAQAILPTIVAACKHCGKRYTPKAANRLDYCSRECAYAAKREIAKKCPVCGLTATQHATKNFCPVAIKTVCGYCGKTFLARSGRKCCSQACYRAIAARKDRDRTRARPPVTKECANCGKRFSLVFTQKGFTARSDAPRGPAETTGCTTNARRIFTQEAAQCTAPAFLSATTTSASCAASRLTSDCRQAIQWPARSIT